METLLRRSIAILVCALSFVVFVFSSVGLASSNVLTCTKEEATPKLKKFFEEQFKGFPQPPEVEIYHVLRVKEVDFPLCAVVYAFLVPNLQVQGNDTMPVMKQVIYYGSNFFIAGNLVVIGKDGSSLNVSQRLHEEHNRPYFEWLRRKAEEEQKKYKFKSQLNVEKFEEIKKNADLSFVTKDAIGEVIVFFDPFCPFCKRLEEVLKKLRSEKLVSYYLILTPALGKQSSDVIASVLCDKKTADEKMKALADKYVSKRGPCKSGLEKAQKNLDLFMNTGGRGVPLSIIRVEDEIKVSEGAISETEMRRILRKSSN